MPGLLVFRPADANEVVETWRYVLGLRHEPAVLVLSRQALPTLDRSTLGPAEGVARGAYVLADAEGGDPNVLLVATGSEVSLALAAREELAADGIAARVVSMPCMEIFRARPRAERAEVLPPELPTVAVEAASPFGWHEFADDVVGLTRFGASAPGPIVFQKLGITAEAVADRVTRLLGRE
jgi:transketolase